MTRRRLASRVLRTAGIVLVLLGVVHLAATPHIPHLLDSMPAAARQIAVGPTVLNHVLVGVLLLPLGLSTWLAAARGSWTSPGPGECWSRTQPPCSPCQPRCSC